MSSHSGGGGGGDLLGLICPELGVTPLVDPGTDCEDELPDPADIQSVPDHVTGRMLHFVGSIWRSCMLSYR